MTVINKFRMQNGNGRFAKGLYSVAIDQRSGFKELRSDMTIEPGTGWYVLKEESDKENNLVTDPLNYGPKIKTEGIGLKYTSPDVQLSVGTIVSATAFGSVAGTTTFYDYPASLATTE